jgi:hypothetical protein
MRCTPGTRTCARPSPARPPPEKYETIIIRESRVRPTGIMISAIRSGSLEIVEAVAAVAGDCDAVRDAENFNTPLHFCAVPKAGADIARLLISRGHRPAAANRYCWTPVDFARTLGNLDAAATLTADCQDPDSIDARLASAPATAPAAERAPRMVAAAVRAGQGDLLRFLLAALGLVTRAAFPPATPARTRPQPPGPHPALPRRGQG